MHAAAHENSGLALRALVRAAPRDVSRVVVVSVVDEALSRVLDAAARRAFRRHARVHPLDAPRARGVTNSYRDTWRLGADRWVSAIGAHALATGRTAVIANVGTALTIDAVTGERSPSRRRHRSRTRDHGREPARRHAWHSPPRAAAARARVARRCSPPTPRARWPRARMFAAAAFIDRAVRRSAASSCRARPLLILTGGAAPALAALSEESGPLRARPGAARPRGVRAAAEP